MRDACFFATSTNAVSMITGSSGSCLLRSAIYREPVHVRSIRSSSTAGDRLGMDRGESLRASPCHLHAISGMFEKITADGV